MKCTRAGLLAVSVFATLPLLAGPSPSSAAKHEQVLPFMHDNYAKALGDARARQLPLFIEAWAPW